MECTQVDIEAEVASLRSRISYLEGIVEQIVEQCEQEEDELFGEEEGLQPEGSDEEDLSCGHAPTTAPTQLRQYRSRYAASSSSTGY